MVVCKGKQLRKFWLEVCISLTIGSSFPLQQGAPSLRFWLPLLSVVVEGGGWSDSQRVPQNNKMEALPAYKNACISPLKASPMHNIIALITPSMVRTWFRVTNAQVGYSPRWGNKRPGRLLSMNGSRYMYAKVRALARRCSPPMGQYMYGKIWRAGTNS